jgi:hypothetical protein
MTKEEIAAVLGRNPMLHSSGMGRYIGNPRTGTDWDQWLAAQRATLADDVDGCSRAETWLKGQEPVAGQRRSSYLLRDLAEREMGGKVSQGALITAALHLGLPCRLRPGDASVDIALSPREPAR